MTEELIVRMMSVVSLVLQGVVVTLSLILYGYLPDKNAWWWFLAASIVVFVRRVTGTYGMLSSIDVDLVEAFETAGISVMWIIYILKRSGRMRGG